MGANKVTGSHHAMPDSGMQRYVIDKYLADSLLEEGETA